jgi:hypothetical protein
VPTSEAFNPLPTVGLPVARTGGHAAAQAPEQALFVPTSFWNKYTVRPCESTRILPRPVFATPIVADDPLVVLGGVGDADAVAPLLPPPQPATASATMGTTAAPARKLMGLRRVMLAPSMGLVDLSRLLRAAESVVGLAVTPRPATHA